MLLMVVFCSSAAPTYESVLYRSNISQGSVAALSV